MTYQDIDDDGRVTTKTNWFPQTDAWDNYNTTDIYRSLDQSVEAVRRRKNRNQIWFLEGQQGIESFDYISSIPIEEEMKDVNENEVKQMNLDDEEKNPQPKPPEEQTKLQ